MITKDTFRNQFNGLSTDNWATTNPVLSSVKNGDVGFEMDTSQAKMWDEQNQEWRNL